MQRIEDLIYKKMSLYSMPTYLMLLPKWQNILIVDITSHPDECYSIFNFVWKIIHYMWEQTLENIV